MKELYGVLCLFIMIIFSFFDFSRDIFQMLPVFSVSTSRTPPLAARPTPRQSPRNGEHTPFPADSIGASRLIILHQRPDIRQQPDLNMPDIKIILHTWRHPYKWQDGNAGRDEAAQREQTDASRGALETFPNGDRYAKNTEENV